VSRGQEQEIAMSTERIPMTREGYEKLKAELDRMGTKEMIEVTKRIATARELGDLSENAEYPRRPRRSGHASGAH